MKKIIITIILTLFLFSCQNNEEKKENTKVSENKIETQKQVDGTIKGGNISVDGTWLDFNYMKTNEEKGEKVRKMIFSNFKNFTIAVGEDEDFLKGISNFNGESIILELEQKYFTKKTLSYFKNAKGKALYIDIGVNKKENLDIKIDEEIAKILKSLEFENIYISSSFKQNMGKIICDEKVKNIIPKICKN